MQQFVRERRTYNYISFHVDHKKRRNVGKSMSLCTTIPSHILLLLLTRLPQLTSYYAQSTLSLPPLSLLFTPIRPPYSPRLLSRPYQQPLTHPIHTLLHHIFSPILYSHANLSTSHSLPLPSPITLHTPSYHFSYSLCPTCNAGKKKKAWAGALPPFQRPVKL